jgi:hypothetical protein
MYKTLLYQPAISLSLSKSIVHISLSLFSFHLKGNGGFKNRLVYNRRKTKVTKR